MFENEKSGPKVSDINAPRTRLRSASQMLYQSVNALHPLKIELYLGIVEAT